jgi:hypothetical protein
MGRWGFEQEGMEETEKNSSVYSVFLVESHWTPEPCLKKSIAEVACQIMA